MSGRFLLAVLLIVTSGVVGGCREREDLSADTVRVTLPERTVELEVISCGLDGDVFVLGASSSDALVQILLRTTGDDSEVEVDRSASALSVEIARKSVLGAGSATLLQVGAGVPGSISSAEIRGDRIDIEADAREIEGERGASTTPVSIEARCPAVDEFV